MQRRVIPSTVVVVALVTLAACGGGGPRGAAATVTSSAPASTVATVATTTTAAPSDVSYVAEATAATVAIYSSASASATPTQTLDNPTANGGPLVFLLTRPDDGASPFVEAYLPVRPNGSTGWVRRSDVTITRHRYRIVVEVGAHRITVTKGSEVVLQEPVGIGTNDTPTPGGTFYIKELLQPPTPDGPYGPYAYGLSGFSNVLTSFAGGDGVIGIHGTNDPSSIGKDVSHGCIRMSNDGITSLVKVLPLGTPVEIRA